MINSLTSLRFFFAFIVFLSHVHLFGNTRSSLAKINLEYLNEGHLGVSFFFILSGFILAYNYQDHFLTGKISKQTFWINRIIRIYPLHLITLILAAPLSLNGFRRETFYWFTKFFLNLSLVQSWFPNQTIFWSFNAPSWSISNEFFFYFMFPFLILNVLTKKYSNTLFILFLTGIVLSINFVHKPELGEAMYNIHPLVRISDFILGIFIYKVYKNIKSKNIFTSFIKSSIYEISAIILLLFFYLYRHSIPINYRFSIYYWIPMCITLLIFTFQKGIISKILNLSIFIKLGEVSFSFYLIHMVVARYFNFFVDRFEFLKNDWILVLLIFSISISLSFMSHYYLEKKISQKMKNYFEKF